MNFKSILEKIGKEITFKNMDKLFKEFDKGMITFNKGMNDMLKELSLDAKESNTRSNDRERQNKKHLASIWGSKSNTKIWSN